MALSLFEDMMAVLTELPRSNRRVMNSTKNEDVVRFKLSSAVQCWASFAGDVGSSQAHASEKLEEWWCRRGESLWKMKM